MKSVTLRTKQGKILVKIIHRKSGEYELIKDLTLQSIEIEVRDDKNRKIMFNKTRNSAKLLEY